jgi:nitrite reductase/ring-hydroxylating ferredoxin subunit
MSEGDVQGTKVACSWHGADFDLEAGAGRIVRSGGKELALELEENGYAGIINGAVVPA